MDGVGLKRATVLVVDDTPPIRVILSDILEPAYRVVAVDSGGAALEAMEREQPDLVLLDVMLPDCSGFNLCRHWKADPATRDIPVIFLTTLERVEDQAHGLEMGAVDFITKPVHPLLLTTRVATHLRIKDAADFLRDREAFLEREVVRRTQDVLHAQQAMIMALTSLADTRDDETGSHSRRTRHFVRALAEHLKEHPRFCAHLDEASLDLLVQSAPHTTKGRDALQRAEDDLGADVAFLRLAKEMAYSHQERWNGSGYPEGRRGDDIPVSARLMAVADVYDALTSRRAYKPGMPHAQAVSFIADRSGIDFDPDVADAFVALQDEFEAIARGCNETRQDPAAGARA
jgi:putative two-component system response regulator